MSCKDCEERRRLARDALLRSAVREAAVHVVKGAAELTGLKKKTAMAEREEAMAKCNPASPETRPDRPTLLRSKTDG